jgi:hypothetical protein
MINRLLYVATAAALISIVMFDENFAANLWRAADEPIDITLNAWEIWVQVSSACWPAPFTGSAADENLAHLRTPVTATRGFLGGWR